jgi:hypothetical protein
MEFTLIGWRELVSLSQFKLFNIKAKIDTGAKTSALHAENIEYVTLKGIKYVRFTVESEDGKTTRIKSRLIEERDIKSSTGHKTRRPVVKTKIELGRETFEIEITLINRDLMGFKMLIGRDALGGNYFINPARSYLLGK